jgi:hypothetical protein
MVALCPERVFPDELRVSLSAPRCTVVVCRLSCAARRLLAMARYATAPAARRTTRIPEIIIAFFFFIIYLLL